MKMDDSIIEYLYIDNPRLDSYFEQISSPVMYEKVPVWKAVFGLAGPKAEATQIRPGRPFTTHEKVKVFHDYLRKKKLVIENRPAAPFDDELLNDSQSPKQFRKEVMSAQRVRLDKNEGLNIWVSTEPDKQSKNNRRPVGALFLIEDFSGKEDRIVTISAFSSLWALIQEMEPIIEKANSHIFEHAKNMEDRFGRDPVSVLKQIGAKFGPVRRIQATYRIRVCGMEMGANGATTTIGYPIVISAV
ncbi:hypothetical protein FE810_15610 [Thalassotalea litorea]|uniref:Uncharacterized protein n=1 Tax=Thalassotalea litorea TaxID=2020715 RepID=A0A5R9IFZ5_9GAMM|nr:hypothetical protein [Thalassotalea litorea]TLU61098.1 hypothetical protein FE810_15610 [Thalassotalea litorea]